MKSTFFCKPCLTSHFSLQSHQTKPDVKIAEVVSQPGLDVQQKSGSDKKSRKTVSWAREAYLEEIFYFDMDETERGR